MGVKITELLPKQEIEVSTIHGKTIAIDASLFLYQFLTSIRQRDGSLLTDSDGNVTSHLVGVFSRTSKLMQQGIKPVYVFDGKPPELKREEQKRRSSLKEDAATKYKIAVEKQDIEGMKKYGARTSKLTGEMIGEVKELLNAMGVGIVQAPSEGEAQASHLVKKGDAFAVGSQDSDCLLFGAPRLLRNLSAYGKRKINSKLAFETVSLELIELKAVLSGMGITQDQLIALGMLIGTDYNIGGIKGIGPKNGLKLVKQYKADFGALFKDQKWDEYFDVEWQTVYDLFHKTKVTEDYSVKGGSVNSSKVFDILVEQHDFSKERVEKTLEALKSQVQKRSQKTLGDY